MWGIEWISLNRPDFCSAQHELQMCCARNAEPSSHSAFKCTDDAQSHGKRLKMANCARGIACFSSRGCVVAEGPKFRGSQRPRVAGPATDAETQDSSPQQAAFFGSCPSDGGHDPPIAPNQSKRLKAHRRSPTVGWIRANASCVSPSFKPTQLPLGLHPVNSQRPLRALWVQPLNCETARDERQKWVRESRREVGKGQPRNDRHVISFGRGT